MTGQTTRVVRFRQTGGPEVLHIDTEALRPVIDCVFGFDQIVDAHRYLESNAQVGE
jgi:Zinc-binding dehydrogenase